MNRLTFNVIIAGSRDFNYCEEMAKVADALIAFWDGESRGTKHMVDLAKEYALPTRIIYYKKYIHSKKQQ